MYTDACMRTPWRIWRAQGKEQCDFMVDINQYVRDKGSKTSTPNAVRNACRLCVAHASQAIAGPPCVKWQGHRTHRKK
eukprot:1153451-Pelagomonas_calceolata.AAC.1